MLRHDEEPVYEERSHGLLTIRQVAEQLSVSCATVRRLVGTGQIPTVRVGGSIRFEQPDIRALIARGKTKSISINDEGPACQPDPVTAPAVQGQQRATE